MRCRRGQDSYWLLVLIVVVTSLWGYAGYVWYPRFELPPTDGAALVLLAAGAAVASFFSPCAFPLLVTLLARETATGGEASREDMARGLVFATALAAGAASFLLLSGGLIALGGAAAFSQVTFTSLAGRMLRAGTGASLIGFGLIQVGVLSNPLWIVGAATKPALRMPAQQRLAPAMRFGVFGFAYLLAGFGWTGPILAGLAVYSFTAGGASAALAAFGVAAIIIVGLMFTLSLTIATAQDGVVKALRAHAGDVKRAGGWILIAVGVWVTLLAVFAEQFARVFAV